MLNVAKMGVGCLRNLCAAFSYCFSGGRLSGRARDVDLNFRFLSEIYRDCRFANRSLGLWRTQRPRLGPAILGRARDSL